METSENQNQATEQKSEVKETTDVKQKFPNGVKREPSNDEELHLKYIEHFSELVDVYLSVSDNKGFLFKQSA